MHTVSLPNGEQVPCLGQGTWYLGDKRASRQAEADALRLGIDLGMTLIDTAEMYADGGAEEVVALAAAGQRDKLFIVSKVYPHNASRSGVPAACARSLKRLNTDRIDLYLLHWRGGHPLAETTEAFETLKREGKIRHWGVSNFDTEDMVELGLGACAANQVLYHPDSRGIEFDLLPWCAQQRIPVMAYSPLSHSPARLLRSPALTEVAQRHGATPAQIALAWGLRHRHVISIPKASNPAHVRENAATAALVLSPDDLATIDAEHKPPRRKMALDLL
ncbi:MAG: aldo/keto reductase [Rhodospirillales bacterium]